jgi:hypothetical protein
MTLHFLVSPCGENFDGEEMGILPLCCTILYRMGDNFHKKVR